jgi:hypothetical protein
MCPARFLPAIETQSAKRLAPLPWAPAHGATGILAVVGPLLRRHVVFARAGSPRHQEGWCLGARSVRVVLTQLNTRGRATAGVPYTALCRQRSSSHGHNAVWGSPGNGLPEKRATATKKAVEPPGGGRCHSRRTGRSSHRRAASRSGGAMSAERDGRPVGRGNSLWVVAGSESIRIHDSCARHVFRFPGGRGAAGERGSSKRARRSQAPLKRSRDASGRKATGGRQAPLP